MTRSATVARALAVLQERQNRKNKDIAEKQHSADAGAAMWTPPQGANDTTPVHTEGSKSAVKFGSVSPISVSRSPVIAAGGASKSAAAISGQDNAASPAIRTGRAYEKYSRSPLLRRSPQSPSRDDVLAALINSAAAGLNFRHGGTNTAVDKPNEGSNNDDGGTNAAVDSSVWVAGNANPAGNEDPQATLHEMRPAGIHTVFSSFASSRVQGPDHHRTVSDAMTTATTGSGDGEFKWNSHVSAADQHAPGTGSPEMNTSAAAPQQNISSSLGNDDSAQHTGRRQLEYGGNSSLEFMRRLLADVSVLQDQQRETHAEIEKLGRSLSASPQPVRNGSPPSPMGYTDGVKHKDDVARKLHHDESTMTEGGAATPGDQTPASTAATATGQSSSVATSRTSSSVVVVAPPPPPPPVQGKITHVAPSPKRSHQGDSARVNPTAADKEERKDAASVPPPPPPPTNVKKSAPPPAKAPQPAAPPKKAPAKVTAPPAPPTPPPPPPPAAKQPPDPSATGTSAGPGTYTKEMLASHRVLLESAVAAKQPPKQQANQTRSGSAQDRSRSARSSSAGSSTLIPSASDGEHTTTDDDISTGKPLRRGSRRSTGSGGGKQPVPSANGTGRAAGLITPSPSAVLNAQEAARAQGSGARAPSGGKQGGVERGRDDAKPTGTRPRSITPTTIRMWQQQWQRGGQSPSPPLPTPQQPPAPTAATPGIRPKIGDAASASSALVGTPVGTTSPAAGGGPWHHGQHGRHDHTKKDLPTGADVTPHMQRHIVDMCYAPPVARHAADVAAVEKSVEVVMQVFRGGVSAVIHCLEAVRSYLSEAEAGTLTARSTSGGLTSNESSDTAVAISLPVTLFLSLLVNCKQVLGNIVAPVLVDELRLIDGMLDEAAEQDILCAVAGLGSYLAEGVPLLSDMMYAGRGDRRLVCLALRTLGGANVLRTLARTLHSNPSVKIRSVAAYALGLLTHDTPGHTTLLVPGGSLDRAFAVETSPLFGYHRDVDAEIRHDANSKVGADGRGASTDTKHGAGSTRGRSPSGSVGLLGRTATPSRNVSIPLYEATTRSASSVVSNEVVRPRQPQYRLTHVVVNPSWVVDELLRFSRSPQYNSAAITASAMSPVIRDCLKAYAELDKKISAGKGKSPTQKYLHSSIEAALEQRDPDMVAVLDGGYPALGANHSEMATAVADALHQHVFDQGAEVSFREQCAVSLMAMPVAVTAPLAASMVYRVISEDSPAVLNVVLPGIAAILANADIAASSGNQTNVAYDSDEVHSRFVTLLSRHYHHESWKVRFAAVLATRSLGSQAVQLLDELFSGMRHQQLPVVPVLSAVAACGFPEGFEALAVLFGDRNGTPSEVRCHVCDVVAQNIAGCAAAGLGQNEWHMVVAGGDDNVHGTDNRQVQARIIEVFGNNIAAEEAHVAVGCIAVLGAVASVHTAEERRHYSGIEPQDVAPLTEASPTIMYLLPLLESLDDDVREAAANTLAQSTGSHGQLELIRILFDHEQPTMRLTCATALRHGGASVVRPLIVAINDTHDAVRYAAVDSLAFIGGEAVAQALLQRGQEQVQQANDVLHDYVRFYGNNPTVADILSRLNRDALLH